MKPLTNIESFAFAAHHYFLSNEMQDFKKSKNEEDSKNFYSQRALRFFLISTQTNLLIHQINTYKPSLNFCFNWKHTALVISAYMFSYLAELQLKEDVIPKNNKEKLFRGTCKLIVKTFEITDGFLDHADKVLNTASLVNAIALISLGFPVSGSIALLGLFAIALKRYDYMPQSAEGYIAPIIELAKLSTSFSLCPSIISNTWSIGTCAFNLTNLALDSEVIAPHLPQQLLDIALRIKVKWKNIN
jgi:hypothetical protein